MDGESGYGIWVLVAGVNVLGPTYNDPGGWYVP